jgi:hypothetical protein
MGLVKNIILGSGAALVSVAAAQAADLPAKRVAPVEYVRICDAYGAGFFFIPGTQTCLKIGGRVRADYSLVRSQDIYSGLGTAAVAERTVWSVAQTANATGSPSIIVAGVGPNVPFAAGTTIGTITPGRLSTGAPVVSIDEDAVHVAGWEARGRIDFDARTNTPWGTVQATAGLRLARTTGVVDRAFGVTSTSAGPTLEYAYVRFAGFTFGAARDNFAFMPSLVYGAGHWGSFANGAKQIAYTATLGGGVSATFALQDYADTAPAIVSGLTGVNPYYVYNSVPQINGNVRIDQPWGSFQMAAAYANVSANTALDEYDDSKGVYAFGVGAKINLPALAQGDALYLTANYANGMTEYTTNWSSFKSSAYRRDVGGFVINHPSVVAEVGGLTSVKSWNVAALLEHYWTPQYRSVVFGTYGQLDAPRLATACVWDGGGSFGDATVWNIGTNFAWLPTRNFEIGVEVLYARVSQDVRGYVGGLSTVPNSGNLNTVTRVFRETEGNVSGRLRVERTF